MLQSNHDVHCTEIFCIFSDEMLIFLCRDNIGSIKELIETIKEKEMRSMVRIILYGLGINESLRDEVHADAYAESEQELFDIVHEIVNKSFY